MLAPAFDGGAFPHSSARLLHPLVRPLCASSRNEESPRSTRSNGIPLSRANLDRRLPKRDYHFSHRKTLVSPLARNLGRGNQLRSSNSFALRRCHEQTKVAFSSAFDVSLVALAHLSGFTVGSSPGESHEKLRCTEKSARAANYAFTKRIPLP